MNGRQFNTNDIHLALDGELSADERADFERWLEAHPDMRALSARYERDRSVLAAALAPVIDEPVPQKLKNVAEGETWPRRSWSTLFRSAAAAVVLLAVGGIAGYLLATSGLLTGPDEGERFADDAIMAFETYAADQPHSVEVGAEDKAYLDTWLSQRVGVKLVAPDLDAKGFELLGGRVLTAGRDAAALLVYKDKDSNQLSIYVSSGGGAKARGTYAAEEGGPTAIYWVDPRWGCAIIGAMPPDRLADVARAAWDQMKASAAS